MNDILCTCGHKNSEHFCFEKLHKIEGHQCDTAKTFCEGPFDKMFSCPCIKYRINNLSYLESLVNDE